MCDVVSALMVASTVMGVAGGIQQSRAASANASFQQQLQINNAKRTDAQIRDAKVRGADKEQQVLRAGAQHIGSTRGALAANNMDLSFGSPLDTILETSIEVSRDAYRVRRNTVSEINNLNVQKANQLNQASVFSAESSNAKTAGFITGVGTALSGASRVAQHRADIS